MFNICGPKHVFNICGHYSGVANNLRLNKIQKHQQILLKTLSVFVVCIKYNIQNRLILLF